MSGRRDDGTNGTNGTNGKVISAAFPFVPLFPFVPSSFFLAG
jgi:hypothetical protein